ncbi:MAG: hypothetical protein RSD40_05290, partial [Bacilli bacterium]
DSNFDTIFSPSVLDVSDPTEILKIITKKIEEQKKFFLDNFKKDKTLKFQIFKKLGYSNLLDIPNNLEVLDKVLNNPNFIKLFKRSDITLDGICKIILIYDKSSEYFLDSLKLKQQQDEKKLDKLEKNYNYFKENSKDILDFNNWLNQRLDDHLNTAIQKLIDKKSISTNIDMELIKKELKNNLIIFSNSDVLFYDYFTDAQYLVEGRNPFGLGDRNVQLNFFVRELKNIFDNTISNKIICELSSIIFKHELDETSIKNILKNANTNPINTQMMTQITVGKGNNIIEHFKAIDKF